jgi:hypothetical protein
MVIMLESDFNPFADLQVRLDVVEKNLQTCTDMRN